MPTFVGNMDQSVLNHPNSRRGIDREILRIALPSIVTNVTVPLLGLLDVAIAGHIGKAATIGAVAMGSMIFNFIYWNFGFLRMGTSGMTAQAYGKGDRNESASILLRSGTLAAMIAIAIMLLQWPLRELSIWAIGGSNQVKALATTYYNIVVWGAMPTLLMMAAKGWMLGMQDSRNPMVISIAVNLANVLLSLLAVVVLKLGFAGIAFGTVTSQWMGLALTVWLTKRHHGWIVEHTKVASIKDFHDLGRFFKVNSHIFLRSSLLMCVSLFFLSAGARSGDLTLAANSMLMQLFTLYSYFTDGVAFAGEALVGRYWGERNRNALTLCVSRLMFWAAIVTALYTLAYTLFPHSIFGLITTDTAVIDHAMLYRWWAAAIPIVSMVAFVMDGVFIGLTRTRAMLIAVAAATAMFLGTFFLLPSSLGNNKLWAAFIAFLGTRSVVQSIIYKGWHLNDENAGNKEP